MSINTTCFFNKKILESFKEFSAGYYLRKKLKSIKAGNLKPHLSYLITTANRKSKLEIEDFFSTCSISRKTSFLCRNRNVTGSPRLLFFILLDLGIWHIYLALSSNSLSVCPDKLMAKYVELKRIWKRVIPWYPFTPSIHRIRHIPLMIKLLHKRAPTLRIGMMTEEAGESVNKFLKASVTSVVEFQGAE